MNKPSDPPKPVVRLVSADLPGRRKRSRRCTIGLLTVSHLVLLAAAVGAILRIIQQERELQRSAEAQALLRAQRDRLQARLHEPIRLRHDPAESAGRVEHYIRKLARDVPGITSEVYNDPDLGHVAEYLDSHMRYRGRLVPEAVMDLLIDELNDYRKLKPCAPVIRQQHDFIQSMPREESGGDQPASPGDVPPGYSTNRVISGGQK
jgi:hypothetical protein